jgi:ribosomal protein L7Ae-like RNA K-turn-binding protein
MSSEVPGRKVERLLPFALRARILIPGREQLSRSKQRLHFVLITTDISEGSRSAILSKFASYPVVQHFSSEEIAQHFGLENTKVLGFKKSGLAQSIYAELKHHRLNKPPPATGAGGGRPPESPV